jgi:ParB family chromosome partitioning protein
MKYQKVRLDQLNFTSTPVRLSRSDAQMRRLKSSIAATGGPIDPIIVRELGSREYVVVAGESRVLALTELGYPPDHEVPCLVGQFDDKKALEYGLIENYVRNPLSPYEEALVIRSLVTYYEMSQREVAGKLGKSEQHISHILSVFELCEEVQQALHEGRISLAHARELYALRNTEPNQRLILKEILWRGLSVKATRTRIRELIGAGKEWIIEPGETRLSDKSRVAIHPSSEGYKVDFTFGDAEEFEKVISYLRSRLKSD